MSTPFSTSHKQSEPKQDKATNERDTVPHSDADVSETNVVLDATSPRYAPLLEKLNIPPEKRQQYLNDIVGIIQFALDGYFEELQSNYQEEPREL